MGRPGLSIGIIIQARMGSSRLPGKILMDIGGSTLLAYILNRLQRLKHDVIIVVATTVESKDDVVVELCNKLGAQSYRGSEANVLERYYLCAKEYGFDQVIRMTADNPFTDIEELDRLIEMHFAQGNDFSHSFPVLPIGVGAEIFTFNALEASYHEAREPHHIEHVDEFLLENPERFQTGVLKTESSKNMPEIRLTVDTPDDYALACKIVNIVDKSYITTIDAIEQCLQSA